MKYITICLQMIFILSYGDGYGQIQSRFNHLSSDHGLTSNETHCLLKDNRGFLWIGTDAGLNRFDGKNIVPFTHVIGDSTTIVNNFINTLYQDKLDRIWIGTKAGLSIIDSESSQIINLKKITIKGKTISFSQGITSIKEFNNRIWLTTNSSVFSTPVDSFLFEQNLDKVKSNNGKQTYFLPNLTVSTKKGIWFLTSIGALYTEDGKSFYNKYNNPGHWPIFNKEWISALYNDGDSVLYFATFQYPGVYVYRPECNSLDSIPFNSPHAKEIWILSLCRLNKDEIIGGSNSNGMFCINTKRESTEFYIHDKTNPRSLSSNYTTAILKDNQSTLFLATDRGLDYMNQLQPPFKIFNASNTELESMNVQMVEDDRGRLWFASPNKGLFLYEPASGLIESFQLPGRYNRVWSILFEDNKLMLGTNGGLAYFDTDLKQLKPLSDIVPKFIQDLTDNPSTFIIKDNSGSYWIALFPYDLLKYNIETSEFIHYKSTDSIYCLPGKGTITSGSLDENGILWVSYKGNNFSSINTCDNSIQNFKIQSIEDDGVVGDISSIVPDNMGNVWFGTTQAGLFKYNIALNSFKSYDSRNGLSNNILGTIVLDQDNNLWINTANGLNKLAVSTETITTYNSSDGLPSSQFNTTPMIKALDGTIYTSSDIYLVSFNPRDILPNPNRPIIVFPSYSKSGENHIIKKNTQQLNFSFSDKMIRFEFFGINFIDPAKTQYAYMLDGYDNEWQSTGSLPYVTYTSLPPGNYRLRVKASNKPNEWDVPETTMNIQVKGPYWSKLWFLISSFSLCTLMICGIHRYRLTQYKKLQAMRNRISKDLHDDLGSTLSSISINSALAEFYVYNKDQDLLPVLKSIGEHARAAMDNMSDIVWAINPSNETFQSTMDRFEIFAQKILGAKNIKLHLDNHTSLNDVKLTMSQQKNIYLILKESVNNIAKYSEANNCYITASISKAVCFLKIEDDGNGFDVYSSNLSGNGICNMKSRAEELNAELAIVSHQLKGTVIELQFNS